MLDSLNRSLSSQSTLPCPIIIPEEKTSQIETSPQEEAIPERFSGDATEGLEVKAKNYVKVTFSSGIELCKNNPCITASGRKPTKQTASCPRNIKLGTKIKLNGVEYICEDRLSKKMDGYYNVYLGDDIEAYNKALALGTRKRILEIIN